METTPLDQEIEVHEPEKGPGKKPNKTLRIVLMVLLLGVVVVACTLLTELFIIPFAKPLIIKEGTATFTPVPAKDEEDDLQETAEPEPTEEEIPTDEPVASACTETGTMSFLILGVDMPYSDPPKGADAIRLVQLDFSLMTATMIAVPRDMWVSTPVLNGQNIFSNRIGLTYHYAKNDTPSEEDETVYATTMLAQTLYDNFGFVPDHYMTLHLDKFVDIIDALGGVSVQVPVEYESVSFIYTPGLVSMNGDQAMEYASNLINDDTVWERLDRQQQVIEAIMDKVSSPMILTKLPALVTEFNAAITTDLSLANMIDLTCLANDITFADVEVIELGSPYVSPQADSVVLKPDKDMIIDLLQDVFD